MLRLSMYLWNSIRGYMYQFYNTDEHMFYHIIGTNVRGGRGSEI